MKRRERSDPREPAKRTAEPAREPVGLQHLLHDRNLAHLGWILALLGFVVTLYLYERSESGPRFVYHVSAPTLLEGSVARLRITFWNAGRKAIFDRDVLQPFQIVTNGVQISGASIVGGRRPASAIRIREFSPGFDQLTLVFTALGKSDGAAVDLLVPRETSESQVRMIGIADAVDAPERLSHWFVGDPPRPRAPFWLMVPALMMMSGIGLYLASCYNLRHPKGVRGALIYLVVPLSVVTYSLFQWFGSADIPTELLLPR